MRPYAFGLALACAAGRCAAAAVPAAPAALSSTAASVARAKNGAAVEAAPGRVSPAPSSRTAAATGLIPAGESTLGLLGYYGTSPLRWRTSDLLWLAPSVALSWVTLHNDLPIYRTLSLGSARKTWLNHSMPTVSALGEGLTEAGLTALGTQFGSERFRRTSVTALEALSIAAVYGQVFKFAAWSNRPYENDQAHTFFDYSQHTMGMPSGHSFSAFAVAEVYGAEYGREWTYPVAALIVYSRVYNQDHWPSDVVVGSLLGITAGVAARHFAALNGTSDFGFGVSSDAIGTPEGVFHARF